jgi:hypothetical protein
MLSRGLVLVLALLPLPARAGERVLARGLEEVTALAADSRSVYVGTATGEVLALSRAGGKPVRLLTAAGGVKALATDEGSALYLVLPGDEGDTVARVRKAGGPLEPIAIRQGMLDSLAIDREFVYWPAGDRVGRYSRLRGGVPGLLGEADQHRSLGRIAACGDHVYFAIALNDDESLWRFAKSNGRPELVIAGSWAHLDAFSCDDRWVYAAMSGKSQRARLSGGPPEPSPIGVPAGFVGGQAIFLDAGRGILRRAVRGGPPVRISKRTTLAPAVFTGREVIGFADGDLVAIPIR